MPCVAGALSGLFSQILSGDDLIREKAVKFMAVKLKNLSQDVWTADLESYFVQETKKVIFNFITHACDGI